MGHWAAFFQANVQRIAMAGMSPDLGVVRIISEIRGNQAALGPSANWRTILPGLDDPLLVRSV